MMATEGWQLCMKMSKEKKEKPTGLAGDER